jgi:hypothetical protein
MAFTKAPPVCGRTMRDVAELPFTIELELPGEDIIGYSAMTEDCDRCEDPSRHVMVTGWLVVSSLTLSRLDNDGVCYAQRVLHPVVETTTCERCGAYWGNDGTCSRCTREDGSPRPVTEPGPLGPGATERTGR